MSERDSCRAARPKAVGPDPGRTEGRLRSRPALLEGRASDSYHPNQQVIIEFCQRERLSKLRRHYSNQCPQQVLSVSSASSQRKRHSAREKSFSN